MLPDIAAIDLDDCTVADWIAPGVGIGVDATISPAVHREFVPLHAAGGTGRSVRIEHQSLLI